MSNLLAYLHGQFPATIGHLPLVDMIRELEEQAGRASLFEHGKYGTRHLGEMLALSQAQVLKLRTCIEKLNALANAPADEDDALIGRQVRHVLNDSLTVPAPPVVSKEAHDTVVAELVAAQNERSEILSDAGNTLAKLDAAEADAERLADALANLLADAGKHQCGDGGTFFSCHQRRSRNALAVHEARKS